MALLVEVVRLRRGQVQIWVYNLVFLYDLVAGIEYEVQILCNW